MKHPLCSTKADVPVDSCMDTACLIHGEAGPVICCAVCLRRMVSYGDELPEERVCDDCAFDSSLMEVVVDIRIVLTVGKDTELSYGVLEEDIREALISLKEYPDELKAAIQQIVAD